MNQHRNDVKNGKSEKSALAHHALTKSHTFKFEDVDIIARHDNYRKRMFIEELCIKASNSCVNFKSNETRNVNSIYTKLLEKYNSVCKSKPPQLNASTNVTDDNSHTR